jgi:hypothetical protein
MHYANIRKRKVKVEQAVQQASSLSSSSLTLTSGSGGIKAEPDEREHGYESKGRAVSSIKEHNEDFGDSDDDNEYSDSSSSSNNNGGGDREKGRGSIMELERELELGGVEGGDAFIELWGESAAEAARHDRFGGGDGSVFGGAVPMAQHRTKFPGRERERRWRRRDHLTTSREQMEEPRGLFFSSGVPSPSSSSSIQDSTMMAAPPGNLAIWNAAAHLDLMMAVRYYRYSLSRSLCSTFAFRSLTTHTTIPQGSVQEDIVESDSHQPDEPQDATAQLPLLHRGGAARAELAIAVGLRHDQHRYTPVLAPLRTLGLPLSIITLSVPSASFGVGHFDVAEEFFHKVRASRGSQLCALSARGAPAYWRC